MRFAALAVMCLTVTACGSGAGGAAAHTLTVEQAVAPSDVVYEEGALAEVVVVDAGGRERTATGYPSDVLTFDDLPTGRYTVRPALRPCDGNCDYLDARTGECQAQVGITGPTTVRVTYVTSQTCRIG